jgi:hypothetical protein
MTRSRMLAACLVALLTLQAIEAQADLVAYDVDAKYRQEVFRALRSVLVDNPGISAAGGPYGRLELLPNGQILIDARPETHAQIEAVLEAVTQRRTDAAPRISLRYWVLLGGGNVDGARPAPEILREVTDELQRVHGAMTFQVFGTASLVTQSGQEGEVDSLPVSVSQRAYVEGDTASARIEVRWERTSAGGSTREGNLELDVALDRGKFLVLGESTVRFADLDGTLFYIVYWPEE